MFEWLFASQGYISINNVASKVTESENKYLRQVKPHDFSGKLHHKQHQNGHTHKLIQPEMETQ